MRRLGSYLAIVIAAACVTLLAPAVAHAQYWDERPVSVRGRPVELPAPEGALPPPGYVRQHRKMKSVWVPGIPMLTAGWFISASIGVSGLFYDLASLGESKGDHLAAGIVPLAGGFIVAADEDLHVGWRATMGVLSGVQNLGLILIIAGVSARHDVFVLVDRGTTSVNLELGPASAGIDVSF